MTDCTSAIHAALLAQDQADAHLNVVLALVFIGLFAFASLVSKRWRRAVAMSFGFGRDDDEAAIEAAEAGQEGA